MVQIIKNHKNLKTITVAMGVLFSLEAYGAGAVLADSSGILTPGASPVGSVVLPGDAFYHKAVDYAAAHQYGLAKDQYVEAVKLNHPRAQYNLALLLMEGREGVASDRAQAVELLKAAARSNHPRAQFTLGTLYDRGEGIVKDEAQAIRLYEQSAAAGYVRAKSHLAVKLADHSSGESDLARAVNLYKEVVSSLEADASKLGDPNYKESYCLACTNLSRFYMLGLGGVDKDVSQAVALLAKAAEKEYAPAQFNLAIICKYDGKMEEARRYFEDAASNEYEQSYYFLGSMLEDGVGGGKNEVAADSYYRLAARFLGGGYYSPLQFAAKEGRLHALQVMVEAGGDLLAVNRDGMDTLKIAIKYGHEAVVDFIQRTIGGSAQEKVRRELAEQAATIERLLRQLESLSSGHETEIRAVRAQLDPLAKKHREEEEIERVKAYIDAHPELRIFYGQFQRKLGEFFLAYKVLNTGLVTKTDDAVNNLAKCIGLAGEMVALPGAALITRGVGGIINYTHDRHEKLKIAMVSNLIENTTIMDKELEQAARKLTVMYEPQIDALTTEGAKTLSERAVRRIVEYVRAEKANDTDPLSDQIILAIVAAQSVPGPFAFMDKTIATKVGILPWTDTEIFQLTGIETPEGKRYVSDATRVDKLSYRRASRELAERLGFYEVPDLSTTRLQVVKPDGTMEEIRDFAQLVALEMTTEDLARAYRTGVKLLGSVGGGAAAAAASVGAASSTGAEMATAAPLLPAVATEGDSATIATTSATVLSTGVTAISPITDASAAAPAAIDTSEVRASTAPVAVAASTVANPLVIPVAAGGAAGVTVASTPATQKSACDNCCVIQ